jgi:hypothetical protein
MQDITRSRRQAEQLAVRLFLVDKNTGAPGAGMVVHLSADSARDGSLHLASLQTDQNGYVSFKFDRSIIATSSRLTVTHGDLRGEARVFNVADLLAGDDAHTIRFDAEAPAALAPYLGMPAVMEPDVRDLTLSPGSVGLTPQLFPGRGLCSQLMPTTMGVRRFEAFQVQADICEPVEWTCGDGRSDFHGVQIVRGKMREYDVIWHPCGTSLGDLLNSITLAPCEQVKVAVADWMRRETASRAEAVDFQQQSSEQTDHDRLIVETMQSSVRNTSLAGASGTSSGATAKLPLKGVMLNMTAAFGANVSGSITTQQAAAITNNRLSERIAQSASLVASQRSSVVFQTAASEHQTYQTRTIRNHNHCHTLTLMYYQVNRSYRVVTDYKGERDVILIKYDNKDFDAQRAYCNAHVLKDALLDPALSSCFDALGDALFCCDKESAGETGMMDSLTFSFKLETGIPFSLTLILNTTNGPMTLPQINLLGVVQPGGTFSQTISLPGQVDPKQLTSILAVIHHASGGGFGAGAGILVVSDLKVTYHAVGHDDPLGLYDSPGPTFVQSSLEMPTKAELPPPSGVVNECIRASCCVKKLVGHLNCHKRYYNGIVWLNEDPNERVTRWSCCHRNGAQFSLIGEIENEPLTVYGDYVVFPVAGSLPVDDPSVLPVSKLVTMPTPGVYAEGILGQCDTCERIDPDRFWDWKDSPCGDDAPDVSEAPKPQPGVKESDLKPDLKPDLISNLIQFSNVPDAPASIIKDLISTLISKADSGSAEAKALLETVLEGIKESINKTKGNE